MHWLVFGVVSAMNEVPYGFFGLIVLILCMYFVFFAKSKQLPRQEKEQERIHPDKLSERAFALRNSLNLKRSVLDENLPLRVTISIEDVILKTNSENENSFSIVNNSIDILSLFCEFSHVCLIIKAHTDDEEEAIMRYLREKVVNVCNSLPCPLMQHRILFYSTDIGKKAIVRQILPDVHIDVDESICEALRPHVSTVIQVKSNSELPQSLLNRRQIPSLDKLVE